MITADRAHFSKQAIDRVTQRKNARSSRHFISNASLSADECRRVFDDALALKKVQANAAASEPRKVIGLLFQKTSTRTRCSFEAAITELGHHPMYIDWRTSNFIRASIEDESQVLSRYCSIIIARLNRHEDLLAMAASSNVPVINGMCNRFHPCQALADFMTIQEIFGGFEGLKLAYVGDGNNVCQSLAQLSAIIGVPMRIATPAGFEPDAGVLDGLPYRNCVEMKLSPDQAVAGATIVYTDVWVSIGQEDDSAKKHAAFRGFTVDERLFELADRDAIFMHCLPAHRGEEVSDGVIDHPRSVVYEQAENRKHAQKALLSSIFGF